MLFVVTSAHAAECFRPNDHVVLRGTASYEHGVPILTLAAPACAYENNPLLSHAWRFDLLRVELVGSPPPVGMPIELHGVLTDKHRSEEAVALIVTSGRKLTRDITSVPRSIAAADRCTTPPYGGSVGSFKAFIKNFGPIFDDPTAPLAAICKIKFEGDDRTTLYKLGFTDADIASKDTSDLAAEMVMSVKSVVDRRAP